MMVVAFYLKMAVNNFSARGQLGSGISFDSFCLFFECLEMRYLGIMHGVAAYMHASFNFSS